MFQSFINQVHGATVYGKYEIHIEPGGGTNVLISLRDQQTHPLKMGKNIIPIGKYKLIIKKEGFSEFKTNFTLTTKGLKHRFKLKRKPFTLKIESKLFPVDVYLNGEKQFRANDNLITLSNIPTGFHELFLAKSSNIFFYKSFRSTDDSSIHIKAKPFHNYQRTLVLSGVLGLLPGLNYFVHFPKSTAGFVIPSLFINYLLVIGYILQTSGINFVDVNFLPNPGDNIKDSQSIQIGLLVGIIISSLFHSTFSFLGTKNDLDNMRNRHFKNLSLRFNIDVKKSVEYKVYLSHIIK